MISPSKRLAALRLWPTGIMVLFTVSVAVNLAFVTVAFRHRPQLVRLVRDDYYSAASEARASDAPGWSLRARTLPEDSAGIPMVEIVASQRNGSPCDSLEGSAAFYRPSNKTLDIAAHPLHFVGHGRYLVLLSQPLTYGAWRMVANVSRHDEKAELRVNMFGEK